MYSIIFEIMSHVLTWFYLLFVPCQGCCSWYLTSWGLFQVCCHGTINVLDSLNDWSDSGNLDACSDMTVNTLRVY